MKRSLLLFTLLATLSHGQTSSQIIPRPRIEKLTGDSVTLAAISVSGNPPAEGLRLLEARTKALGCSIGKSKRPTIVFEKCPPKEMAKLIVTETLDPKRLAQAYRLTVTSHVKIKASGDLGLYYGIVSLVQLLEADSKGNVRVPAGEILDWPEIALRLSKTSATDNDPARVNRFTAWMPLYKVNQVGLQFHGKRSLELDENFTTSIKTICGWARQTGICEAIVYFCPFRSKPKNIGAYDFKLPEHKAAYVKLLQDFLAQGAHGIEVDYNDWGDTTEIPIEDVINLACNAVWQKDPSIHVFWCAPNHGPVTYHGPATPELARILSKISDRVWPLWVGSPGGWIGWKQSPVPLATAEVEAWTKVTGRRPFLWLNRVAKGVPLELGRSLDEIPGARVFRGEDLPRDLNRLFAGIHFNAGMSKGYMKLPDEFAPDALAFFATAVDFVWNPRDWKAIDSYRRARRFVEVMSPLLEQSSTLIGMRN